MNTTTAFAPLTADSTISDVRIATPKNSDGTVDVAAIEALYAAGEGWRLTKSGIRAEMVAKGIMAPHIADSFNEEVTLGLSTNGTARKATGTKAASRPADPSTKPQVADEAMMKWLGEQTWSAFAQSVYNQWRVRPLSGKQIAAVESMYAKATAKQAQAQAQAQAAVPASQDTPQEDAALIEWLAAQDWSSFAVSLTAQVEAGRTLSERQKAAAESMKAKCDAREAREASKSVKVDVPDGRYAVDNDKGTSAFYNVKDGIIRVYSSDTLLPLAPATVQAVADKIMVDHRAAGIRFGQEIGKCCACGRTLTNDDSRKAGLGPVCESKW